MRGSEGGRANARAGKKAAKSASGASGERTIRAFKCLAYALSVYDIGAIFIALVVLLSPCTNVFVDVSCRFGHVIQVDSRCQKGANGLEADTGIRVRN